MKKLSLKEMKLGTIELLTREQMKSVIGGLVRPPDGPGDCVSACGDGIHTCSYNSPYCLTTNCTDSKGVSHEIKGCSPTLPQ